MIRRELLAVVALLTVAAAQASAQITLLVDPDLSAYLYNATASDISFDAYSIFADTNGLDVDGWYSISDRLAAGQVAQLAEELGFGALGFGEVSPTSQQLYENNLAGVGVLKAGAKFALGKPFGEGGYRVGFSTKDGMQGQFIPRVPEPSTLLLATLAGVGLLAFRRGPTRSLRPW